MSDTTGDASQILTCTRVTSVESAEPGAVHRARTQGSVMAAHAGLGTKIFYKIGEVSEITELPAYVLRFWESEFHFLKPKKTRGRQRLYVRRDIETVLEIKRMLYEEGYTIAGVKRIWARRARAQQRPRARDLAERLRGELRAILRLLDSHEA